MTRHPPGFALIMVLWAMLALALGAATLTATARHSLDAAAAIGTATQAAATLDSAAQHAVFHLLATGTDHWLPSGTHTIVPGPQAVAITLVDQSGLLNPNTASPALLAALLTELGQSDATATTLADAIVEWRTQARIVRRRTAIATRYRAAGLDYAPPAAPFETIAELGLVLGMTPDILATLRPYLSLWWDGDPAPALAPPPLRAALGRLPPGLGLLGSTGSGILTVAITCRVPHAARRLVVQLLTTGSPSVRVVESTRLDEE